MKHGMYTANVTITIRPLYGDERQFAICESCFWCATIFNKLIKGKEYLDNNSSFQTCPVCKNKSVSVMDLANNEKYTMSIEDKRGLELEFSRR